MKFVVILLTFLSGLTGVRAFVSDPTNCFWSCEQIFALFSFPPDAPDDDFFTTHCQNLLRAQSMFLCMRDNCAAEDASYGWQFFDDDCWENGQVHLLPWSVIDNVTSDQVARVITVPEFWYSRDDANEDNPIVINEIAKPAPEVWDITHGTENIYLSVDITREWYGWAMVGYWGLVVFIGMANRFFVLLSHWVQRIQKDQNKSSQMTFLKPLRLWGRRYITTPALFNGRTAQPLGWCTVPPRIQSLTVILFIVINIILTCIDYPLWENNFFWAFDDSEQLWQYLSDRTGIMSMANMPMMSAFAVRNNILLWLTGWDFATYSSFHRWIARVATVQAILHSVGYTVLDAYYGDPGEYAEDWEQQYWYMGAIATIAMSFLCIFSIYPMRRYLYELFLLIHIALAALFLAGMYYHVEIFDGDYNQYIWPCVAVWSFDRAVRISRLVALNFPACKGMASYNAQSDMIHLSVPTRKLVRPRPGTYYYVYLVHGFKFWESHPFTLASWTIQDAASKDSATCQRLSFVVRPHKGFTARFRDYLTKKSNISGSSDVYQLDARVLVEGPYGQSHSFEGFDSALLIVGGSGITVALAHLRALCDAHDRNETLRLRRVHLVWALRDREQYQDIFDTELSQWLQPSGLLEAANIEISIFVTNSVLGDSPGDVATHTQVAVEEIRKEVEEPKAASLTSESKEASSGASELTRHIQTFMGRPSLPQIVEEETSVYCLKGSKLAVLCCGPSLMADDVRAAVVVAMGKAEGEIEFFPESFNW